MVGAFRQRVHYVWMPAVQQGIDKLVWINKFGHCRLENLH